MSALGMLLVLAVIWLLWAFFLGALLLFGLWSLVTIGTFAYVAVKTEERR